MYIQVFLLHLINFQFKITFLCEYVLNCILFLWSKLYFQHHYSSLQCHMIFRNHSNMLIYCSRNICIIIIIIVITVYSFFCHTVHKNSHIVTLNFDANCEWTKTDYLNFNIYIYILGVARYMYSYRTVTVRTSRFGAWCLTTNTGNSPPIQKGAPAAMQHCLITASRRTENANGDTETGALMFGSLYFILRKYQLAVKLAMLELMCVCVCVCVCVCARSGAITSTVSLYQQNQL